MEHELLSCIKAFVYCQSRMRTILPMWKASRDICQPCIFHTGPWPTAESPDCSRKLFISCCHVALSSKPGPLAEGTDPPLESTMLYCQGILIPLATLLLPWAKCCWLRLLNFTHMACKMASLTYASSPTLGQVLIYLPAQLWSERSCWACFAFEMS